MGSFWKDLFRTIKGSIGRFLAIAGICALGVGFFGGLQMTCGSMKQALTYFFNDTNMMDIHIISDMGLSQDNIDAYKSVEGVDGVMPAYATDILTNFGNDQCTIRVHSLPDNLDTNNNNYINQQILVSGQWPQNEDECVLSVDAVLAYPPSIGDEIDILECSTGIDETLKVKKLKVVGFIRSSYYVENVQMGPSVLGKGIVNDVAYVTNKFFSESYPYSEVYITFDGSKNFVTGTDDYQEFIDNAMLDIIKISPDQSKIRTASIKADAQAKLNEAKQTFEEQKANAESELSINEKKLNDAWQIIEESQNPLLEAQKILDDQYAEFYKAKSEVLDPINAIISDAENSILVVQNLQDQSTLNEANLRNDKLLVNDKSKVFDGLTCTINHLKESIYIDYALIELLDYLFDDPSITKPLYADIEYAKSLQNVCNVFYLEYKAFPTDEVYRKNLQKYNSGFNKLEIGFITKLSLCNEVINWFNYFLNTEMYPLRDESIAAFNELEKPLIEAKAQLDAAKNDFEAGKEQYYLGLAAFLEAKNTAMTSLNDAQNKLNDSQKQIDEISEANFYVMDRTKNFGAINFVNDAERIASIANVFPLMFFFVALLVALTSMTRMIEEERITIGTYKALGFSKFKITSKYILYAVFASVLGSIVGLAVLTQFLPYVIMVAYSIIYVLPIPLPMPFDINIGLFSLLIGVGVTIIATLMAATKTLAQVPANLMIPKAPKAGKRIFLEYVKPIWSILNFNWKITFRNMFLYKKRLFMTLIGIAGCTALLLTGFGLHDSINDIMANQFDVIAHDNFKVIFEENTNEAQKDDVAKSIKTTEPDSSSTLIHEENMICMPPGHPNALTTIVVPKNINEFQNMRVLRDRITQEPFTLDDQGVYVSEKLANMMEIGVGDSLKIYNQDLIGNAGGEEYSLYVAGIVENYIAHYVYMTPDIYKKYFNKEFTYNRLIAHSSATKSSQETFVDNVKSNACVKTAFFTTNTRETYEVMLRSVDMVVVVLIVSAGLLAFVVLYNLININICERSREIATLKVLGSNKHEINMYIHRETFMLSIIGSLLGLALGFVLEQFVIASAEVDYVMFGRMIYLSSYLISFGITILFTVLVSLFMRKKLFSISMVESLKSIE